MRRSSPAWALALVLLWSCSKAPPATSTGGGGGIGGTGGSGGSGGTVCPDLDGDGHTDATCGGDDCNDNDPFCTNSCLPSATPLPDYLLCCGDGARYSFTCLNAPGLADCETSQRACVNVDDDKSITCVKRCAGDGTCVCGVPAAGSPTPS